MRAALAILARDLLRWRRNPGRLVFLLALPLVLSALFALAFGSGGSQLEVRVLVEDDDDTALTRLLTGALSGGDTGPLRVERLTSGGRERIAAGEASALLVIPEGFSRALLDAEPVTLELVENPAERYLPRAVEDLARTAAVLLSQASVLFHDELARISELASDENAPSSVAAGALGAAIGVKMDRLAPYLFPPVITLDAAERSDAEGPDFRGVIALVLPGLAVLSLLFFAQAVTRDLMEERARGLVRRLVTAPVGIGEFLAAKSAAAVVVSGAGFGLLLLIGAAAGVGWGPWPAVLLLTFAAAVAAAGLLIFLTSLAANETAANALTTAVVMVSSLVGGSFVPVTALPPFLLPLSRLTVNYWTASAFLAMAREGAGLREVLPSIALLLAAGGLLLAAGAWRLGRRIGRGEV